MRVSNPGIAPRAAQMHRAPATTRRPQPFARPGRPALTGILGVGAVVFVALLSGEWVFGVALATLFVGWRVLAPGERPPVVAAAFTYQWLQVTIALFYFLLTRRAVDNFQAVNYRPMVLLGLASVASLFAGYYLASGGRNRDRRHDGRATSGDQSLGNIPFFYAAAVAASGAIQASAWTFPGLTQILLAISYTRFVFLYLLVSRLFGPRPRWLWLLVVLTAEVAIGFTGFFADFREPLAMIGLAVAGSVNTRPVTKWAAAAALIVLGFGAAITWTAIKPLVRQSYSSSASATERLSAAAHMITPALNTSGGTWAPQVDRFVTRMWTVYYPALALERVPRLIPHTNGAILRDALKNLITPRLFFPNKGILPSESEKVRKYSGIWVAGREIKTSYAFGYAAESYVDFGIPLMFLPIFLFGMAVGLADRAILQSIRNDEVRTGVRVLLLWLTLYQFEVSWVIMIGLAVTLFAVMGLGTLFIERFMARSPGSPQQRGALPPWARAHARMLSTLGDKT